MQQTYALVQILKRALKQADMTYADVARGMNMSEANVKRMFSTCHFSLHRLEAVCELIDYKITDLMHLLNESENRISSLTRSQEEALVNDERLLLVAVCARNHWTFEDIVDYYQIAATDCIRLLARLDRLRLIELMPGNRIRLLVAEDFRWIPGGPIESFFEKSIQAEFLNSSFTRPNEFRQYLGGSMSRGSTDALKRKLQTVVREFAELHRNDAALPASERMNVGLVLALRPWELSAFRNLKRKRAQQPAADPEQGEE